MKVSVLGTLAPGAGAEFFSSIHAKVGFPAKTCVFCYNHQGEY